MARFEADLTRFVKMVNYWDLSFLKGFGSVWSGFLLFFMVFDDFESKYKRYDDLIGLDSE